MKGFPIGWILTNYLYVMSDLTIGDDWSGLVVVDDYSTLFNEYLKRLQELKE